MIQLFCIHRNTKYKAMSYDRFVFNTCNLANTSQHYVATVFQLSSRRMSLHYTLLCDEMPDLAETILPSVARQYDRLPQSPVFNVVSTPRSGLSPRHD